MMNEHYTLHLGNSLEILPTLPESSVDAVVTDPPYELGFMGKGWDKSGIANNVELWRAVLRVLKPGGHLLAFSGTRTYHRMTCAIEDAGFEVRDQMAWVYGSGFPKSHNLEGEWQGWGTALKPAWEPICLARKPLIGTVAQNVQVHGTGALNVDGCRVAHGGENLNGGRVSTKADGWDRPWKHDEKAVQAAHARGATNVARAEALGRWPANLMHDGSAEVVAGFPADGDKSAARFFYCAKASKADRDEGLEGVERTTTDDGRNTPIDNPYLRGETLRRNHHPTVKPTALMRYLCRLITPPNGTVLDPFMGSGSTGKAAMLEGFRFIGIDMTPEYVEIARARIEHAFGQSPLTLRPPTCCAKSVSSADIYELL